jgi:GTP-binding protein HflX
MSQQEGGIGVKGPGETAKERALQYIERRSLKIKQELKDLQKHRDVQRKKRLTSNVKQICLIGYTNSGKSTLLNILTNSDVLSEDKLFATLDTTTRQLYLKDTKIGVISDTVGFIQFLPHHLIEAFKSTLSELFYADLLLHVVDISNKAWKSHIDIVNKILNELNIEKPVLYIFNKVDKIDNIDNYLNDLMNYNPHVIVSALSKDGIKDLIDFIYDWFL